MTLDTLQTGGFKPNGDEPKGIPQISLVVPCYNEEDGLRIMVHRLWEAMRIHQLSVELVLVDNGSKDGTGSEIETLMGEGFPIRKVTVVENQGYGYGVLRGLEACTGDYVGFLCADEQVEASDVARMCYKAVRSRNPRLYKIYRRFRMESFSRRVVSNLYNFLTNAIFGNLGSGDLNGNPKIFPRSYYNQMQLRSTDWFLDAEVMIKAKMLELPVFEVNVFSQMRAEGQSNVKPSTCLEFLNNLFYYRWGAGKALMEIGESNPQLPHTGMTPGKANQK